MKKRTLTLLLTIAITCSLLAGCSEKTTTKEHSSQSLFGQVTNIDGNTLTLALRNENPPSAPDGIKEAPSMSGNAMPEPPSGSHNGMNQPPSMSGNDMEVPSSMPDNPTDKNGGGPQPSGEEREIAVTEDTIYTVIEGKDSKKSSLKDIPTDAMIQVTLEEDGVTASSIVIQKGEPPQNVSENVKLKGAKSIDGKKASSSDETFSSSSDDENAVLVTNRGTLNLAGATINKSGDTSNTDNSNYYGLNAALAVTGASDAELTNVEINSTGEGANAIFATGEGSSVTVDDVKIHTSGKSARGLDATYGGVIQASSVEIDTEGAHCAALATDRGEGTITVNGATLSTAGEGSPCIYSTGEISVQNAIGTASGSQILVVEGKNSIDLTSCELDGAGPNGLMLYQSASGDAIDGAAIFRASDSKLTTTSSGPMIYITNTDSEITLTATKLSFPGSVLLEAAGNEINNWGVPGQNGGTVTLTGIRQELEGDIRCDAISAVRLNLTENSSFTGSIDRERTGKETSIQLDDSSTWEVTGDSYITTLTNAQEDCSNIHSNGHTIYYNASHLDNKWLKGQSIQLPGDGRLTPAPQ